MGLVWNDVHDNISWTIGNGFNADFWYDIWINDVGPSVDHVVLIGGVAAMLDAQGGWNWSLFQHYLLVHILLHKATLKEPSLSFSNDVVGWKNSEDH
ncbi:hypothetical protein V6N13_060585 [Hibiscus sabdariffa]